MALLGLVVDVVLIRLMMFRVNVERFIAVSEHMAEFVSHEPADIIGISAFKPHVKPPIGASLLGLSVSLPPVGSEDAEAKFLVLVQLKVVRPINRRHFVNEAVEGLKKHLRVFRGWVFVGWNGVVFFVVFIFCCHEVRMP